MHMIYFLLALVATTLGAMTGMGGGVIMKPLLDVLGHFDASSISLLSSVTVFAMSIVSISKKLGKNDDSIKLKTAILISLGSVLGGYVGQFLLNLLINFSDNITLLQNIILGIIILGVFIYMQNKEKIPSLGLNKGFVFFVSGFILGSLSSFLSIGGGPINVALLIYLFSFDTKTATTYSIITIFFSQITKLASIIMAGNLESYDLSMAPFMIIGAILGGILGSNLNKKLSEKNLVRGFNLVQLIVMFICIYNIIKLYKF